MAAAGDPEATANDNDAPRVVEYEDMTDAQKRIVDAGQRPGIPLPELSGGKLVAWLMRRAVHWSRMTDEERAAVEFLEAADDEAFARWQAEMDAGIRARNTALVVDFPGPRREDEDAPCGRDPI